MNFKFWKHTKHDPYVNFFSKEAGQPEEEKTILLSEAMERAHLVLDRVALDSDGHIVKGSEKHYMFNRAVKKNGKENVLAVVRIWKSKS